MRVAFLAVVVMTALSCGDDDDDGEPEVIGRSCETDEDCADRGIADAYCLTAAPGGYCTLDCTEEGTLDECEEGAVCDQISTGGETFTVCLDRCNTHGDCRADYDCNGVSGISVKACEPKEE